MITGRKPKPTQLKLVTSNPGKRQVNRKEAKAKAAIPAPPAHLNADAVEEWNRVATELYTGAISVAGTITASGDITAYSDASVKTEVATISNALDLVKSLRGVSFTRIDSGNRGIGVIAQELAAVLPEAVQANDDGLLSVAYGNLVGVLIEAVKELVNKVERLEARA